MANSTCANMLQVHHSRWVRLDDDGSPFVGASSLYEHTRPISVSYTERRPDRVRIEGTDGAGDNCGLYNGPPRAVQDVELAVVLCKMDAELIEMAAGGAVITNGTYGTIGYVAAVDETVNINGVALETWSVAQNGRQRHTYLGAPAWYRHLFPKTSWQVGQVSMQADQFTTVPLTGVGEANSGYATGLADDPFPASIGAAPYAWVLDDEIPDGECGYQEIAA